MRQRETSLPTWNRSRRGFTIVELLIVVVVIAILAAITIVAYNGVTSRANDAARLSDANALQKGIGMRHVETGNVGYGSGSEPPETKAAYLALYRAEALLDRTIVCDFDACYDEPHDRSKVYITTPRPSRIDYAYWSSARDAWITVQEWCNGDQCESRARENYAPYFTIPQ